LTGYCQTLLSAFRSDAEAIAVAHKLTARFAIEASVRDRERRLPVAELYEVSASNQPHAYRNDGPVAARFVRNVVI
jgi:hypothetical protein